MARGGEVVGAPPSRYGVALFCGRPDRVLQGRAWSPSLPDFGLNDQGNWPAFTNFVIPHAREAHRHERE